MQVTAQNQQQRKYKPGDMLEDGSGYIYKIIRCDGEGEWTCDGAASVPKITKID
jgi:hypothetical protein